SPVPVRTRRRCGILPRRRRRTRRGRNGIQSSRSESRRDRTVRGPRRSPRGQSCLTGVRPHVPVEFNALRDGAMGDATPLSRDGGSAHGMEERATTRAGIGEGAGIPEFSFRTRSANLSQMRDATFDFLVIGGGIVGAGVARDAASRGYRTVLVDRGDFAGGTSGKTSRLIHGGLGTFATIGSVRCDSRRGSATSSSIGRLRS